ncbi:hypothetical protein F6P65_08005, partial [Streptococcus suis]|nr:hypothetical protein [Streptococcus suis]MBS8075750.1 hypothetical protein [Streptococcus suis]MBS8099066.1 hypothetical protein [Streptococcus suis]MBS8107712.1 hypothetical protein [Streptococcus suis]MBS8117016.1 hypothetical protein [Streptococcus suis]
MLGHGLTPSIRCLRRVLISKYRFRNGTWGVRTLFLPFVKSIKVFDEKYFEFNSQNKEIVLFWTK